MHLIRLHGTEPVRVSAEFSVKLPAEVFAEKCEHCPNGEP
jgi:hypothetical protein